MDCKQCREALQAAISSSARVKTLISAIQKGSGIAQDGQDKLATLPVRTRSNTTPIALMRRKHAVATSLVSKDSLLETKETPPAEMLSALCRECSTSGIEAGARAFLENPPPTIVLCANRLRDAKDLESALIHELIHAYDFCVKGKNLYECKQLAYSEVRAAREAECFQEKKKSAPLGTSWFMEAMHSGCIERNAVDATKSIYPEQAEKCVAEVFLEAVKDLEPFSFEQK